MQWADGFAGWVVGQGPGPVSGTFARGYWAGICEAAIGYQFGRQAGNERVKVEDA